MCVLEYLDFCVFEVTRMVVVSKLLIIQILFYGWSLYVTEATCTVVLSNGMTKGRSLVLFLLLLWFC